jgi:hypothetical protein
MHFSDVTLLFEQWIILKNLQFILLFLNKWTLTFYCFRLKTWYAVGSLVVFVLREYILKVHVLVSSEHKLCQIWNTCIVFCILINCFNIWDTWKTLKYQNIDDSFHLKDLEISKYKRESKAWMPIKYYCLFFVNMENTLQLQIPKNNQRDPSRSSWLFLRIYKLECILQHNTFPYATVFSFYIFTFLISVMIPWTWEKLFRDGESGHINESIYFKTPGPNYYVSVLI